MELEYKDKLIKSTRELYDDIQDNINCLVNSRISHDKVGEDFAIYRMESLAVSTLQQLDCVISYLEEQNIIKVEK
jgi:hypothetical protein